MEFIIDRRAVLATGAALAVSHILPVRAQDKPTLRFAAVFSEKDIRADMIRMVSKDVEAGHRARRATARQPGDG